VGGAIHIGRELEGARVDASLGRPTDDVFDDHRSRRTT
jgi:hypothetical protein